MADTASVAGTYSAIDYAHQLTGEFQCATGTLTLHADGTYTATLTGNSNGAILSGIQLSGTFTVGVDGSLALTSATYGDTVVGHISSAGELVLAQTTAHEGPEILVGMRAGGSFSAASIAGTYSSIDFAHQLTGEFQCATGSITLKPDGTYDALFTGNADGTIVEGIHASGTFTVTPDGTLAFKGQGGDVSTGHIGSNGELVLAQTTPNEGPEISVGVRTGGTFSAASVAGSYSAIDYSHQLTGENQCVVGTLTLAADGTYTALLDGNTDGVIATHHALSGTFTVGADGSFALHSQFGDTMTGAISSSGELLLAQTTANEGPEIMVALRNDTAPAPPVITGTEGNDTLAGSAAAETIYGLGGHDQLTGSGGNDTIDGGAGIDTAFYGSTRGAYNVSTSAEGATVAGASDGTDSLTGVERLHFSDSSLALDLAGNAGEVAKILGAVFGAASVANPQYVGIGLGYADGGMSYESLMQFAINARLGSTHTHEQVVALLWQDVVGGVAPVADMNTYKGMLDSGTSEGALGILAADYALNLANIHLTALVQSGLAFI